MGGFIVWVALGLVAGALITLLFISYLRGSGKAKQSISLPAPSVQDDSEIAELRQNLRLKVLYDEAKIDRLIEIERERTPSAGLVQLMRNAIQRWERDNR